MNYREAHVVSLIMPFLAIAVSFFIPRNSSYELRLISFLIVVAIIITGFVIRIAFCRCPNCRRVLFVRPLSLFSLPEYCPRCGEPLE